ncbi:Alpha/beta hydrolase [Cordyceps fumosorosea ARSEF 2679]|uniref:Alpha/beta hydrolase n=1 Tax=Cordyceps fumosorosea (strain ARSEF 2679) TaxID=1081104 RepID=A0A167YD14_CORFA|nr:Alpha/beta hydrolase [Cordyceps fumosorosea ARSEF 2679]OAA66188.1 Alpha/beta hydrolase [Cordyceps fumosorosea ARSEF 2679]
MATEEGVFKRGDVNLYTKAWTPAGPVTAKLIFVHGFSEHINRYNDFFPKLSEAGIQVFGFDQRGWGRSTTKKAERGLTGPTSVVIADVAAFIEDKLPSAVPVFVMGHSMGGGEVLTLAADPAYGSLVRQVRGWLLDAPFIGFAPEDAPSSAKVFVGRLVGRLLPRQQLKHEIPAEHLSRDPAVVAAVRDDPLCHNTGTLEGMASLLDRTGALSSGAVALGADVKSLFLAHGTADKTCSYDASSRFFEAQPTPDKTHKPYEGAYHQIHADLCKDDFARDIIAWIAARCDNRESVPAESKL